MAKHNDLGALGERVARQFLTLHGFVILDHNVRIGKKEIDIIAEKDNKIHVVEVKTVGEGSPVTSSDNMTGEKKKNLKEAVLLLLSQDKFHGKRIQVDFLSVVIYEKQRRATCTLVEKIEL